MLGEWTADAVGPGWRGIVQPLIDRAKAEGVTILQIKEKFGGLRFYHAGGDEQFEEAVNEAERQSYKTCEECGQPGRPQPFNWVKTLCDPCTEERARNFGRKPAFAPGVLEALTGEDDGREITSGSAEPDVPRSSGAEGAGAAEGEV